MHGTEAFQAVKKDPAFILSLDLGKDQHQHKQTEHDQWQHPSDGCMGGLGAP
jgi:hypothetical protein